MLNACACDDFPGQVPIYDSVNVIDNMDVPYRGHGGSSKVTNAFLIRLHYVLFCGARANLQLRRPAPMSLWVLCLWLVVHYSR